MNTLNTMQSGLKNIKVTPVVIPSALVDAIEYFPLTMNYNNHIIGSSRTFSPSISANVSFTNLSNKLCAYLTSNAYIISNDISIQLPISFCFWCYVPVYSGSLMQTLSIGTGDFQPNTACLQTDIVNDTNFSVYFGLPATWTGIGVGIANNNKWSHICYTISSTSVIIYVDGVLKGSATGTTFNWKSLTSYKYVLGRSSDGSSRYLNGGGIRHFARFNRVLTSADVNSIMNATV